MLQWIGISERKYYKWKQRHGQKNAHNAPIPKEHWLLEWEKDAIIKYHFKHPLDGYRRLCYMMIDANVAAVSPSSVYRVLKQAGLLKRGQKESKKGKGFEQPVQPHEHLHIHISYINICGTFYYLCSLLDGCSRYTVHWEIHESMTEDQVEIIVQRGKEKFLDAKPRIISDNGPQFIAKDFKEFIRISGMTHVRTSPYYPQSNGKIERWHKSLKTECIRPKTPLSLEHARKIIAEFIEYYNHVRLHSALGYVTPFERLLGRQEVIFQERKKKLIAAKINRKKSESQSSLFSKSVKRSQLETKLGEVVKLAVSEPIPPREANTVLGI